MLCDVNCNEKRRAEEEKLGVLAGRTTDAFLNNVIRAGVTEETRRRQRS